MLVAGVVGSKVSPACEGHGHCTNWQTFTEELSCADDSQDSLWKSFHGLPLLVFSDTPSQGLSGSSQRCVHGFSSTPFGMVFGSRLTTLPQNPFPQIPRQPNHCTSFQVTLRVPDWFPLVVLPAHISCQSRSGYAGIALPAAFFNVCSYPSRVPWHLFRLIAVSRSAGQTRLVIEQARRTRLPAPRMANRRVPHRVRVVALLAWFLSGKSDLGMSYVLSRGENYDLEGVNLFSAACIALLMAGWLADQSTREAFHAALSSMENEHRVLADQYLMHSLLMEFVIKQNQKGIAVDLTTAIAKYIRLWSYRPMPDCICSRLAKLVWQRAARRRFGVNLRREWSLSLNTFAHRRELSTDQICSKATSSWQCAFVHMSSARFHARFLFHIGFALVPWYCFLLRATRLHAASNILFRGPGTHLPSLGAVPLGPRRVG